MDKAERLALVKIVFFTALTCESHEETKQLILQLNSSSLGLQHGNDSLRYVGLYHQGFKVREAVTS